MPRAQRTRRLLLRAGFVAVVAIPVVAILVSTISDRRESSRVNAALEAADCAVDSRADDDAGPGRNHREGVVYEVDPPAGGDHSPSPMPPGRYTAEQAPDPRLVHSMEHGYVIVWHQPDLDEEQLSAIDSVYREYGRDTLVVERPSLDVPVAATAWHKRALCDTVEADALSAFVERYRNKGPEQVAH